MKRVRSKHKFDYVILPSTNDCGSLKVHIVDIETENHIVTFCHMHGVKDIKFISIGITKVAIPVYETIKNSLCKKCIKNIAKRLDESILECSEIARKIFLVY